MTKGESQVNSMYYVPPVALISLAALRKTLTWEISRPGFQSGQCHLFWSKIRTFLNLFSYLYNEDNFRTLYVCGKHLVNTTWQTHICICTHKTLGGRARVCFSVPINRRCLWGTQGIWKPWPRVTSQSTQYILRQCAELREIQKGLQGMIRQ